MYREVQILTEKFNQLFANALMSILAGLLIGQVSSALQAIRLVNTAAQSHAFMKTTLTNAMAAVFFILFINLMVILNFLFGFCALVHKGSCRCDKWIHGNECMASNSKAHRRQMKSLPVIKISFGITNNFVEALTPVLYQQYICQRFVDMLLLK